jgi:hypothetical protein
MLKTYSELINEQSKRGFIERVTNPETPNGYCHYIPHHAVLKDSPTTPIRIVYDCICSPNADQASLNSHAFPLASSSVFDAIGML